MKPYLSLFILIITFYLSACTPNSASGVWKTTEDNTYGITEIVVGFDGRANFTTPKLDNATWHCFWSGIDKHKIEMKCTPSTNPDQEERFTLINTKQGISELQHNEKLITTLIRQDEDPSAKTM